VPLEIVGEIAGGVLKAVGQILLEVVFEIAIKGAGYLICRPFNRQVNPDGALVVVVGLVFWALTVGLGYALYKAHSGQAP
jgi:hypothetical protein